LYMFHEDKFELPSKKKKEMFFCSKNITATMFKQMVDKLDKLLNLSFSDKLLGNSDVSSDLSLNCIYSACYCINNFMKRKDIKFNDSFNNKVVSSINKINNEIKDGNNICKTFAEYHSKLKNLIEYDSDNNDDGNNSDNEDDNKNNSEDDNKSVNDNSDNDNNSDNEDDNNNNSDNNKSENDSANESVEEPIKKSKKKTNKPNSKKNKNK